MIALGCDQGGFELKQEIMKHLEKRGFEFKDYGSYDELTDTQKEFVDNFVAEKMVYQLIDYVYDKEESGNDGKSYRVGTFLLTMPILDDHDDCRNCKNNSRNRCK